MKEVKFDSIQFIKRIIGFSQRQCIGEMKTADFLEDFLHKKKIPFFAQKFRTVVPVEKRAVLKADGKKIPCKSTCFVSGRILNKKVIINSLSEFNEKKSKYNINFNPHCSEISCASFYHQPAVSIAHKDLKRILKARKVRGLVKIKPTPYIARNILVGNIKNPVIVCFAHYDSILTGAWDNAAGVATMMANIILSQNTLKNTLYVFTANEELSYDKKPAYWCRGFRCFEEKYLDLLKKAKKIIVIDGVGIGPSHWSVKYENLKYTIWINHLKSLKSKMKRLGTKLKSSQKIYHSKADDISRIKKRYLLQTIKKLNKEIVLSIKI
ncbi:M28 family peptidase [Candidatus Woesearchaeota archaeon]|nr:M28 family peptidase [Candidatus Woesearchaeota archaeon]